MLRPLLVSLLCMGAMGAVAIAANGQSESFLRPEQLASGFQDGASVAGNLVALTAFPAAIALTIAAGLLSSAGWRAKLLALPMILVGVYTLILILQTAFFDYAAEDVTRTAIFSISPLVSNHDATPSVFIGPIGVIVLAAVMVDMAMRMLRPPRASDMLVRHLSWLCVLAPFVIVAIIGNIRVLIDVPGDPDAAAYFIILPLMALLALAMLVLYSIKVVYLHLAAQDARMQVVAAEAWRSLRRVEWGFVIALGALAFLATMLPAITGASVNAKSFGLDNLRVHTQAQLMLVLLVLPMMSLHATVLAHLDAETLEARPGLVPFWIALGTSIFGAVLLNFIPGAMWAWVGASVPLAVYAIGWLAPGERILPVAIAALALWGVGNTVTGFFHLAEQGQLTFDTNQGVLSLWRLLAVVLIGAGTARSMPRIGHRRGRWAVTSAAFGAAAAIIVFLELPYSAWIVRVSNGEFVAIGTVVASQDAAVRGVIHGISVLGAGAMGFIAARVARPDWFPAKTPVTVPE